MKSSEFGCKRRDLLRRWWTIARNSIYRVRLEEGDFAPDVQDGFMYRYYLEVEMGYNPFPIVTWHYDDEYENWE